MRMVLLRRKLVGWQRVLLLRHPLPRGAFRQSRTVLISETTRCRAKHDCYWTTSIVGGCYHLIARDNGRWFTRKLLERASLRLH